jgi:DNA-binding NtrC family response regulator
MRILIVDDDRDALDDITNAIAPAGYEIVNSDNPARALEIFKIQEFDIVISDVRMPDMSGIELLIRIKELKPLTRVIMMTAFGDLDTAVSAINHHAYAFFGKPIDFKELITTIRAIETEVKNAGTIDVDHERLKKENDKLKAAYQDMQRLVNKMRGTTFFKQC